MNPNTNTNKEKLYTALSMIPKGKVVSYGQLAQLAGLPGAARLAGTTLGQLPNDSALPWHRVIKSNGRIAFEPGSAAYHRQSALLKKEGVQVVEGRVKLSQFGWHL